MTYDVIAEIDVKPLEFENACRAVAGIVRETRAEAGCIEFKPQKAADGTSKIFIVERWMDRAAFDFHHAQDYTKAVFAKYESWLASPVRIVETEALTH